jgi:glyoxylase-like metal-dependent hydrolase (beta-lactamase superfamily II)
MSGFRVQFRCPAIVGLCQNARRMAELYLKQLLMGRDVAKGQFAAKQMQNFVYLVGDRDTGECIVIDPAWDVPGILAVAQADGMRVTGALATHYHPDHVGGTIFGIGIEGLPKLLELNPCKVHLHKLEADGVRMVTGVSKTDLEAHDSGDKIRAGEVEIELLHTPGHTPGSCCFRVGKALLAGDTLFLQGCGRVDLPGGDPEEMRRTLSQRLSTIPGDVVLYPGHAYGGESAPFAQVRQMNRQLGPAQVE